MVRRKKEYTPRNIGDHQLRPESLMMGYGYRPEWSEGAIKCPIFQTSTFTFKSETGNQRTWGIIIYFDEVR